MKNHMFANINKIINGKYPIDAAMVYVNADPVAEESDKELFAQSYLKIALGNAYQEDPEAALRVLTILKKNGFIVK